MDNTDKSKCDVVINHRMGCQIVYLLVGIIVIAMGIIYLVHLRNGNTWQSWVIPPLLILGAAYAVYRIVMTLVKERVNKIPAMVITGKSIILSRRKDEVNEIPFSVIERFGMYHQHRGKNRTTYITIQYKDTPASAGERFERVERIDTSGLNMMNYKLHNLLKERLAAYNERQQ